MSKQVKSSLEKSFEVVWSKQSVQSEISSDDLDKLNLKNYQDISSPITPLVNTYSPLITTSSTS